MIGRPALSRPGFSTSNNPAYSSANRAGRQALFRMVDHEAGLQAGEVLGRAQEARRRHAQLLRIGNVLGVEDREERASGFDQREVERPRFWFAAHRAARS